MLKLDHPKRNTSATDDTQTGRFHARGHKARRERRKCNTVDSE